MVDENPNPVPKRLASSHVRFTEVELKRVQKMSQTTGLSIPDLLKKALFDRMDLERPLFSPEAVQELMTELRRQGNNINQISKKVNSGLMSGWSKEFNNLQRAYYDLRHIVWGNHAVHRIG